MHRRTPLSAAPLAALTLLTACSTVEPDGRVGGTTDLVLATLFVNASAEYDAACRTVYAAATTALEAKMAARRADARPAAVVLDVDETVLDNSPYEVRLVQDGTGYPTGWDEWCNEAAAELVPGVGDFIARARALGVEVFFVTNRKAHLEAGTAENLRRRGVLEERDIDVVLMRGEIPEWTSDKTTRREHVEETHDIVLLGGDNVGDFFAFQAEEPSNAERAREIAARGDRWGVDWFMLPNPMYGGWDEAAIGYDYGADAGELRRRRVGSLDAMR
ncbi:MAG: HAD family acid phosphatase [Planctomycetota bacterium]|nr:HAD family acid phosphatase [Planctomycetota bacterium]